MASTTEAQAHAFLSPQPLALIGARGAPMSALRYVTNPRGVKLAVFLWPAERPKAVVQLIHGHGSYLGYEFLRVEKRGVPPVYEGSWVQELNRAGFSVIGIDNQGAGRSSGVRAYCNHFDEYIDDVMLLSTLAPCLGVPGLDASLPKFAMGASKGGCLAVTAALRHPGHFQGVALLAPMLSLEKVSARGANRLLRPISLLLNAVIPAAALVSTSRNTMHPELQECFEADLACYHGKTYVRNATEYLRVTAWIMRNLHTVDFPFIVFHSENDTMTDSDGSKALYTHAASTDKTLRLVNSFWHILPKEPGNAEVLAEIISWFNARVKPPPSDTSVRTDTDVDMSRAASTDDADAE